MKVIEVKNLNKTFKVKAKERGLKGSLKSIIKTLTRIYTFLKKRSKSNYYTAIHQKMSPVNFGGYYYGGKNENERCDPAGQFHG